MSEPLKIWLCITLSLWSFSNAVDYIVDGETGDDGNDGLSRTSAFRSIKHCVTHLANPGDECKVASGRYHEVVDIAGLRGTQDNPIRITGLEDDRPVWDGTVLIEPSSWDFNSATGVCSAVIGQDITALFLNEDLLTAARWPNALWSTKTIFNNSFWGHDTKATTHGQLVDDGKVGPAGPGLAKSGINANGSMAILNIGSFNTFVGQVLDHRSGSDRFSYNDHFGVGHLHWKPGRFQYYLEASLELLDAPGEWFYDKDNQRLHLIPPEGKNCPDPATDTLRGRTMDYGLTIRDTTGLTVSNMTFFACNIDASSIQRPRTFIDHITLENIYMLFGASSHRMLKSDKKPKWTRLYARAYKKGWVNGKVSVVNSTFSGSEGIALDYAGADCYIHNNLFEWNDWTGNLMEKVTGGFGTVNGLTIREEFSHNTLWYNGGQAGYQGQGSLRSGVGYANISYNHVVGQCSGLIQNDGAGIQILIGAQNGVSVNHNWIRDSPKFGIRFDGQNTNQGYNGKQLFNVAWNTSGLMVKGDNHTVENNIALMGRYAGPGKPRQGVCNLCVLKKLFHYPQIMNTFSVVLNNGATLADGGMNVNTRKRFPLAGAERINNYSGEKVEDNLIDPRNWDFRPRVSSNFTNGDIIGPYLPGYESTYWIPGRKLYKTSTPIPPSGSTVGSDRDVLMFLGAYRADSYHWFFNTTEEYVSGSYQGELEEGRNVVELPDLEVSTVYYWRVDAQWGGYTYRGDTWNFTTSSKVIP